MFLMFSKNSPRKQDKLSYCTSLQSFEVPAEILEKLWLFQFDLFIYCLHQVTTYFSFIKDLCAVTLTSLGPSFQSTHKCYLHVIEATKLFSNTALLSHQLFYCQWSFLFPNHTCGEGSALQVHSLLVLLQIILKFLNFEIFQPSQGPVRTGRKSTYRYVCIPLNCYNYVYIRFLCILIHTKKTKTNYIIIIHSYIILYIHTHAPIYVDST